MEFQWVQTGVESQMTPIAMSAATTIEVDDVGQEYLTHSIPTMTTSLDQIAAENLIFMAQDGQVEMTDLIHGVVESHPEDCIEIDHHYDETQMVTEEVITDDWVQQQGEERVEIPVDQICSSATIDDIDVTLPEVQDQYTAARPYPCDFCSRRFRKKNSLMTHMLAHKNDRPHVCHLCGARYFRQSELMNHLKIHSEDVAYDQGDFLHLSDHQIGTAHSADHFYETELELEPKEKKRMVPVGSRGKKINIKEENYTIVEGDEIQPEEMLRFPIIDDRKPFVCQHCGLSFAREKALLSHTRTHGNDSPLECKDCNEMFWDNAALQEHQKVHQFEASNSEYEPENENETDSETESKYGEFYCHECGMSFHRQDLLRRHSKLHIKKEVIDRELRHCCSNCGESFAEALDLLAHAEIHARCPPFKCLLCGETFFEETTIKKHINNMHSEEMTENSCVLCGKECRDRKALIKHSWDHSREKCHTCSKCGKNFHNKARLKRHMASHRDKSVACDVCHEEFPDGRTLSNHRHSHSNGSGKLFPCNECGKTFGSRSSQQIHVRIHTGERPYGCRFCWKAFADGGTLRKHERIHTGEKPYACSVCPRAFNQRVVLREHIRSHHSGLDCKRGTYFCTVCTDELPSSADLIQHLIQHSDQNTAMQRQPVTGPRKYKRRRKLKPHEIERMRAEKLNNSDLEYSDFDVGNVDDLLGIKATHKREKETPEKTVEGGGKNRTTSTGSLSNGWSGKFINNPSEDAYKSILSNLENTLQTIDTLVVSTSTTPKEEVDTSPAKRTPKRKSTKSSEQSRGPKMIHTQKSRVPTTELGRKKSKTTLVTTAIDVFPYRKTDDERRTSDYEVITPDLLPPTKIESSPVQTKTDAATSRSDLYDAQLLLEAMRSKDYEKYNPNVVNDLEEILRSPDNRKSPRDRRISERIDDQIKLEFESPKVVEAYLDDVRRSNRPRRSVAHRKYLEFETTPAPQPRAKPKESPRLVKIEFTPIPVPQSPPPPAPPIIRERWYPCEMCSARFSSRTALLDHVHIHI